MKDDHFRHVVGFAFTPDFSRVALIRKRKPEWQRGLLNGIGGRVKVDEQSRDAMEREFFEETGVRFVGQEWTHFLTMRFPSWEGGGPGPTLYVCCFAIVGEETLNVRTTTAEEVGLYYWNVNDLAVHQALGNLSWLIPMAREWLKPGHRSQDAPDLVHAP